jgi:hypothetical protein
MKTLYIFDVQREATKGGHKGSSQREYSKSGLKAKTERDVKR